MDCARQSRLKMRNLYLKNCCRKKICCLKVDILPVKTPFPRLKFHQFFTNFGRPPSGARIPIKLWSEINISKFWIKNVTSILPENYFINKCCFQKAFLPVKLPSSFASFSRYQESAKNIGPAKMGLPWWYRYKIFPIILIEQTDVETALIGMFVTSICFRETFKSFWDQTEVSAQCWYKVRTYHLVDPTFIIRLLKLSCPSLARFFRSHGPLRSRTFEGGRG